jgi:uncharacterized protein (TIGR03083 family)
MSRVQGSKDFWLAALRTEGPALRAAAAEAPLDAPVPPCPGWTVLDLVHHLGGLYQWVRAHVSRGVTSAPEPRPSTPAGLPQGAAALAWWDDEYGQLVALFDALDPEMPAWNWAPQAKKAGFWHRRMAHETTVHRWDAQMAAGRAEPIEAKLAADGVSEALDTWLPAGRRKGPVDRQGVVQLAATDVAHEWYLRLRGTGVALLDTGTLLDADDHHTRVLAQGSASDLLLAIFGRLPFDLLDVSGDAALLECLRTG